MLQLLLINLLIFGFAQSTKIILLKEEGQDHVLEWVKKSSLDPVIINLNGNQDDQQKICSSLSGDEILLLDITWSGSEDALKVAKITGIPYIQIDVSISPALVLLDAFLEYRNSTDVTVIFDNPQRVNEALFFWIDTTLLRLVVSEALDGTTVARLKGIRPIPNNFAIIATTSNMNRLLKRVLDEDLLTLPERWNLVFLDFEYEQFNKDLIKDKPVNLVTVNQEVCCSLLDKHTCDCPNDFNMQQVFFLRLAEDINDILTSLSSFDFSNQVKCDNVSSFNKEAKDKFAEFFERKFNDKPAIYRKNASLNINVAGTIETLGNQTTFAEFDHLNGIRIKSGKIKAIKPFYRIGITHAVPWAFKAKHPNGSFYWTGYCADFARRLSDPDYMNFDFEFVEPKSGTFGKKKNGVWNGVIGDLAYGDTDLAITALIMTADREEVVDFVAPYFEQRGITIVMRKPVRKTSLFKFMTVLKLEVWLSIVAALIATGFMVWFLDKYSPYSARNNKKAYPYPCRNFTLKESFWFALTSFTPQGGGEAPKALSGRTLVAAYWLFVVLMLATFTANLAAFLTVERMQTPVQSLEQLAKQSRINYTVVMESDTHSYFINMKYAEDTLYRMWKELTLNASTDETKYRVWDYPIREQYGHILLAINDSNPVASAEEGFRIVNERTDADFAFIHDSSEIKYEITRNCNLTEVGEVFAERPYAVAVQQGSHLQDEISKAILNLQKDRYFEDLQAKYWNNSAKGACANTDDNEGITLESLGGVFIATLFGLALAMVTLVGEVLYYRKKRKNKEAKQKFQKIVRGNFPIKLISEEFRKPVTIGTTFKPVNYKSKQMSDLSHITFYPRSRSAGRSTLPQVD